MRKANKHALKVQSCGNFTAVHVRDIITQKEGIMLIKGKLDDEKLQKVSEEYLEFTNALLGDT